MIPLSTQTKITILVKLSGVEVTGLVAGDFICKLTKSDGVSTTFSLSGNISEIDSVNAPGLYLITLPASILDKSGYLSIGFYNVVAATFDSFLFESEVGVSAQDFITIRKYLINNEIVDQPSGVLRIMDDNGTDTFMSYYLQDEQTKPSVYNIRRKIRKS